MREHLQRLLGDREGNFGLMTALVAVPLVGAAGLAIDFSYAIEQRTQLMVAADAAALGVLSEKSASVASALAMSNDGAITVASSEGLKVFKAQLPANLASLVTDVKINLTKTGGVLSSNLTFTAAIPTSFMQIFGQRSVGISGTATATYQTNAYIDFYILLDNTPSMGLAATTADIKRLKDNTPPDVRTALDAPDGCAFACHATDSAYSAQNTLPLAESLGVELRIDVVRDATKALTADAKQLRQAANQYRMAVYSFGNSADDLGLKEIAKMNGDMDQVAKATDLLELMSTRRNNYLSNQMTDFGSTFSSLQTIMGTSGKGTSSSDRQKILFLVSDGVTDANKPDCSQPLKGTRCMEPIDIDFCNAVKSKGIKIGVVYTTYIPLPDDGFWTGRIKPFDSQIAPAMQACASPGYFIEASPDEDIEAAMRKLFRQLLNAPRLTG